MVSNKHYYTFLLFNFLCLNIFAQQVNGGLNTVCPPEERLAVYMDRDQDGYGGVFFGYFCNIAPGFVFDSSDCDDLDPDVNIPKNWYIDRDQDGFGTKDEPQVFSCLRPETDIDGFTFIDYVTNNDDCDDFIKEKNLKTYYLDADGDGYGSKHPNARLFACTPQMGYVSNNYDADDNDPTIIDLTLNNYCPPEQITLIYLDRDRDGYGRSFHAFPGGCSSIPEGYSYQGGDCDDEDPTVQIKFMFADIDGDGYGDPATKLSCDYIVLIPEDYVMNGNDCNDHDPNITDGDYLYLDNDGDGYGNKLIYIKGCEEVGHYVFNSGDCDDSDGNINPTNTWYSDADFDGYGDPNISTYSCIQPHGFVANNLDLCPLEGGKNSGCSILTNLELSDDKNYIRQITPLVALKSVNQIVNSNYYLDKITYYDDRGRIEQSIDVNMGGQQQDIITCMDYDNSGRQTKEFLSYTSNLLNGDKSFRYNSFNSLTNFYNSTKYENTPNPYSEKTFEASPLNRVLSQAAPGHDWRKGGGHEIQFDYQTNTDTEVKLYEVSLSFANNTYTPTLTGGTTNYAAGELYKTITKDENWTSGTNHTTEEFKDKQGRVVLKRTYNEAAHDTYYVYDGYGNLTYVLPPKAIDLINPNNLESSIISSGSVTSGNSLSLAATNAIILSEGFHAYSGSTFTAAIESYQTTLDELCYQYKYDHRNRLVEKKIPGKGWEYIVYNKLDQPILTQDANLKAQNKWLFTKYDAFGRVAYTGLFNSGSSRIDLQTTANTTSSQYVTQNATALSLGGANVYYSGDNTVYPTTEITEIYTINYYDSYVDVGAGVSESSYTITPITNVKGLATVSKVRVLDSNPVKWITTVSYYDAKSRPIYVYSHNEYLETTDKVKSKLDFIGKVEITETTHAKTNQPTITTTDTFTYDHAGRLKSQKQKINNQAEELIVLNSYDELGQLENKKVGGTVASIIENSVGLQIVDYTYNIRGWLKQINDPTSLSNDLFGFKIGYNEGTNAMYNGNISSTQWKTANTDSSLKTYNYQYDALNRITSAMDNTADTRYSLNNVSYDVNGNILSLQRKGHLDDNNPISFGTMDNLSYYYNGNQLHGVTDASAYATGFKDGNLSDAVYNNADDDYTYDDNANMIRDKNKGIINIEYNHLNLPTVITLRHCPCAANGIPKVGDGTISYVYDALGTKLAKNVTTLAQIGSFTTTIIKTSFYSGNYVYEKDDTFLLTATELKYFNHPEGYVDVVNIKSKGGFILGQSFDYVYQYKDHLGNIRLSYKDNIGTLEILEENNYYPFGLKHKGYNNVINGTDHPYGFGGKEENDELGLEWLDFSARNYDPAIGRWMNLDPLAEQMRRHSPYNYAFNNPIYFIDPDGMAPNTHLLNSETGKSTYIDDGSDDIVVLDNNDYDSAVASGTKAYECPGECDDKSYNTYQGLLDGGIRNTVDSFDTGNKAANKNISSLDPRARTPMILSVMQARIKGIDVRGAGLGGHRTYEEQDALYEIGRTKPGNKVTNAKGGGSNHNFGLSMDVAIFEDGEYLTKGIEPQYKAFGEIAESNGLEWGGRWKNPFDPAHVQIKHGYSMKELRDLPKNNKGHIIAPLIKQ